MYAFDDLSKRRIVLRPEGTAGVIRFLLNNTEKLGDMYKANKKYYYYGPMFRYERPQTGRYRQFYQIGVENLGIDDSNSIHDIEIIMVGWKILKNLISTDSLTLQINSLGSQAVQIEYNKQLLNYFNQPDIINNLSSESKNRVEKGNPLRVLDSKNDKDKELVKEWPKIYEFYDEKSTRLFNGVTDGLNKLGIKYTINPYLWRGLDYYSHTCFEFVVKDERLGASQNTVLAGGRYDSLSEYLGHTQPISAVGWAGGIDRLMLLLEDSKCKIQNGFKIGVTYLSDKDESSDEVKLNVLETSNWLSEQLNNNHHQNINKSQNLPKVSFEIHTKMQNNISKKLDALFGGKEWDIVIMIGSKELQNQTFIVRDNKGNVAEVSKSDLIKWIQEYKN